MRRLASLILVLGLAWPVPGGAADRGTAAGAEDLLAKAIAAFRAEGAEKTLAAITDSKRFVDGDLYVFVFGPNGKIAAHGADKSLLGVDAAGLTDVDGKKFGAAILQATPAGIWVDYKWMNPVSKQVEPKTSLVKNVDGYIFGAGVYKSN